MIERNRNGSPAPRPSDQLQSAERSHQDDIQRLLVEQWKRQIIKQKLAEAKQPGLLNRAPSMHLAALDEISIVSRIGRLWKRGSTK